MKAKKFSQFLSEKDMNIDEGKVKVFMDKILRKMVDSGLGTAYHPKMRDELKEKIEAIVKETMEKYDYVVESEVVEGDDHEVGMAQGQLKAIVSAASSLQNKIGYEEIDLPGWIQDHISQSYNFLKQANDNYHELDEAVEVFRTYNEIVGHEFKSFTEAYLKLNKDNKVIYDKKEDVSYGVRKGEKEPHWKYFHDSFKVYHSEKDKDVLGLINFFNMVKKNHPWSK